MWHCCFSVTKSCPVLRNPMDCNMPDFPVLHCFWTLLKFMSIESVMLTTSNYLILCCPLLLLSSIYTSIRDFSNESDLQNRGVKYWHFNFSHSNEYLTLISFKSDWLDPLAVKWTLKSLLQHHSSKASTLWCSAFFTVELSHPHMTTGKPQPSLYGAWLVKWCLCFSIHCHSFSFKDKVS